MLWLFHTIGLTGNYESILVTGGSGYGGSRCVQLLQNGHDVVILDQHSATASAARYCRY